MREVTIKVECQFVGRQKGWGENKVLGAVKFNAVSGATSGDADENKAFFAATPSGSIEFQTINEHALGMFHPGSTYLVTITSAPDSPASEGRALVE